ncbi:unnamed protein product [Didymodactylos carnosus]|uniref:Uncharacterized protein n=1 Tax=Didymodactylos carnosus TaxID=1234261 RepID=A0A8S2E8Y3_9BILA|nr:unnamed protein product [Didymodactylos carnosus]CAF3846669.1 unnamed protein product [Didymodactylos carnosus]
MYSIRCNDCEKVYIGQTGNEVTLRMEQHEKKIALQDVDAKPAVHATQNNHKLKLKEPTVMAYERHEIKRQLKETLLTNIHRELAFNAISLKTRVFYSMQDKGKKGKN